MDISDYKRRRNANILCRSVELQALLESSPSFDDVVNNNLLRQAASRFSKPQSTEDGNQTRMQTHRFKPSPSALCRSERNVSRAEVLVEAGVVARAIAPNKAYTFETGMYARLPTIVLSSRGWDAA
jgi:hypothetical protein